MHRTRVYTLLQVKVVAAEVAAVVVLQVMQVAVVVAA